MDGVTVSTGKTPVGGRSPRGEAAFDVDAVYIDFFFPERRLPLISIACEGFAFVAAEAELVVLFRAG